MRKISISNVIFYISYIMLISNVMLSKVTFLEPILNFMQLLALSLMGILIVLKNQRVKKNTFIQMVIFTIIIILSYISSYHSSVRDSSLVMMLFVLFSAKSMEFDSLIKMDFKIKCILFIMELIFYFFDLTSGNSILYRENTIRYTLGFGHPNILAITLVSIILEYFYLKKEKIKKIYLLPLAIFIIIIDLLTDSRSSLILLILVFILFLFNNSLLRLVYNKKMKKIVVNSFFIFTFVSFLLVFLYSSHTKVGLILNKIFSNRLYYISKILNYYDVNLLGQNLILTGEEAISLYGNYTQTLDNCYIYLLFRFGIFSFLIMGYIFKKNFEMAYNEKKTYLIWILFFFMIYGLMEKYTISIFYNVFILYFIKSLYEKKRNLEVISVE